MAINISSLQDWITYHPNIIQTTIFRDLTLRHANVTEYSGTTPGLHRARLFYPDVTLSQCCTIPTSAGSVIEKDFEAACILAGDEYCETDLSEIIRVNDMRFTAGLESAGSIEELINTGNINSFVKKLELISWNGTKPADAIDGLLTQAEADAGTVKITPTANNVWDLLLQISQAVPRDAYGMGRVGVFVPAEWASLINIAFLKLNQYNFNDGNTRYDYNNLPVLNIPGVFGVDVIPTIGLNGTNRIIATPEMNIGWFFNRMDDYLTLDWDYEKYHQKYYWRIKTIFGVGFAVPEWVVVATVDPDLLTAPYCPCNVETQGESLIAPQMADLVSAFTASNEKLIKELKKG